MLEGVKRTGTPSNRAPGIFSPETVSVERREPAREQPLAARDSRTVRAWKADTPDPRGAAPLRLGDVLVGASQFVAQQTGAYMTQEQWRSIVGERIAQKTRVGKLYQGCLQIHVASSAWCAELSFLKADLLLKLERAGREVRDLQLRVDAAGNVKKKRFVGRREERDAQLEPVPEPEALPDELLRRLALVEDLNLRAAIFEAARRSLRSARREPSAAPQQRERFSSEPSLTGSAARNRPGPRR